MTSKILVLSGKKESGKNTLCNYLHGITFKSLGLLKSFVIDESTKGKILATTWSGETEILDLCSLNHQIYSKYIKDYAFADDLKNICHTILLLNHNQCYGSNDEKNTITKYIWENMVGIANTEYKDRTGQMTGREVMQYIGTEVFRKMYTNVWVEACFSRILSESPTLSIVTDCRFPNEVMAAKAVGAKVVRLKRNVNPTDQHYSETALDSEVFDWNQFDYVLDNENTSIEESCLLLQSKLEEWEWL